MISVIVPVYNVERYLDECVQSILIQSFRNIEVILVDDGSKDGSGAICDSYAASDDRVRVIHKENGGPSDARNVGIESATGEYLLFIDSDDFIEKDAIEKIMDRVSGFAVKPDLVFLEAFKFFPDGTTTSLSEGINND